MSDADTVVDRGRFSGRNTVWYSNDEPFAVMVDTFPDGTRRAVGPVFKDKRFAFAFRRFIQREPVLMSGDEMFAELQSFLAAIAAGEIKPCGRCAELWHVDELKRFEVYDVFACYECEPFYCVPCEKFDESSIDGMCGNCRRERGPDGL